MTANRNLSMRSRSLLPVAAGLIVTQCIATLFVRHSNGRLSQSVAAMEQAGWLPLPAGPAARMLQDWGAALGGGLFFTLSVGVGLTLATWSLLYLWQRLSAGRPRLLWIAVALWLCLVISVNVKGWVPLPTLLAIFTPLATALAALRIGPAPAPNRAGRLWPVPLLTLVLLTSLWATQLNAQLFVTIRDQLLLSNAFGRSVNDFYYRYTLHAAECFKTFAQKSVRTGRLEGMPDAAALRQWTRALANQDVVTMAEPFPADITIRLSDQAMLVLAAPTGKTLEAAQQAFLSDPRTWLARFSQATDRHAPFRRMTFVGLLLGFPILLYIGVDGLIGRMAGPFVTGAAWVWSRSAGCLVIGVLLFVPMLGARPHPLSSGNLGPALSADHWHQRVAALRYIEKERLDLVRYPQYKTLLASSLVVERYWVARALAHSREAAANDALLALIRDPHPNVVCQAYYALGERGERDAVVPIRERLLQSGHWYSQWYAYRAMRRLGWQQTPSTSAP
jgi:hypothetical protein